MDAIMTNDTESSELSHFGIKGQKWGERRYQNSDGSYTAEGRLRYGLGLAKDKAGQAYSVFNKTTNRTYNMTSFKLNNSYLKASRDFTKKYNSLKIDALDIANRKGVLDFLGEFSNTNYASSSDKSTRFNYTPKSTDFRSGFSNIKRYSDLIGDKPFDHSHDRTVDWIKKAARYKPYQDSIADAYIDLARHPRSMSEDGPRLKILTDNLAKDKSNKPNAYREAMGKTTDYYMDRISPYYGISLDESIDRLGKVRADASAFIREYNMHYNALPYEMRHSDFLMHHGTKGQKWGHRQYQNKDGSLTPLGRVHYGVGAARKAVGKGASVVGKGMVKGASAIGKAIRKKNNKQTDEELNAELDKAKANYERKKKQELIDALNGKKKKVSDMTDQEVIDMINRYKNEKQLKNLKKDANKSRARLYIEEAARKGLASAVENTTRNLLVNIGQGVVDSADTEYNKSKRAKETSENRLKEYENTEKLKKLKKGEKDASEELKKQAQDAENAKKILTNKLELEALQGDPFAAKHIHDVAVARKGKRYSENSDEAKREKEEVQKIGKDFLNSTVYAKEHRAAQRGLPARGESTRNRSRNTNDTSSKSNTKSSSSETNTNSSKKKKKKKRNQQDDDQ